MHPIDRLFRFVLPLGGIAVLGTVLAVGWLAQPDRFAKGYAPEQPIPFSHQLHAGTLKIACAYCHSVTKTDKPAIQTLARAYANNEPIAWQRVHTLPDHVFFDHRPHVNAGIACQTCHGEVQNMPVLRREMGMRMANCLACHRDPHAALPPGSKVTRGGEHCAACHR